MLSPFRVKVTVGQKVYGQSKSITPTGSFPCVSKYPLAQLPIPHPQVRTQDPCKSCKSLSEDKLKIDKTKNKEKMAAIKINQSYWLVVKEVGK